MRAVMLVPGALAMAIAAGWPKAQAEIVQPWCAHYFDSTGATNCGFDSEEQCKGAISGNGGYCMKNALYREPPSASPQPAQPSRPAFVLTAQEKMKTCQFGADDQKLTGAKRKTFISRCMANVDERATPAKQPRRM